MDEIVRRLQGKILFFDFDGTIAETEPYHRLARNMVLKEYGISWNEERWRPYVGHTDRYIFTTLKQDYGLDFTVKDIISRKLELFRKLADDAGLQPYKRISELVHVLPNLKYVITAQQFETATYFLRKWKLYPHFAKVISLSESRLSKPEKIIEMGVARNEAVLLDDTPSVVDKARSLGIGACLVINSSHIGCRTDDPFVLDCNFVSI